jgi:hypothetical protein
LKNTKKTKTKQRKKKIIPPILYIVIYKMRSRSKSRKKNLNKSLYDNGSHKPRTKTGYGDVKRARMTLRNIKKFSSSYKKQVVNTMYNRAKYHKNQTKEMRDAMKLFKGWLEKNK